MTEIVVDFSNVKADEFSIVPPGEYDCTIASVKYGKKESDEEETYPYLNIDMTIDEGQDYANSHLYHIASFSPKGEGRAPVRRSKFLLLTLGVDLNGEQKWQIDAEKKLLVPNLVGQPVHVRVGRGKNTLTGDDQATVLRIRGKNQVEKDGQPKVTSSAGQYK